MEQIAVIVALGLSLIFNIILVAALVHAGGHIKEIAAGAMDKSQDAMDAILAATNLPAADFHESMRSRSLRKLDDAPVERERTVLN